MLLFGALLGPAALRAANSQVINPSLPITADVGSVFVYDSSHIFYLADPTVDGRFDLYMVSSPGGTPSLLATSVLSFQYVSTSNVDAVICLVKTANAQELYRVSFNAPSLTGFISGPLVAGGNVVSFQIMGPANGLGPSAVFLADKTTDEVFSLYSFYLQGTGNSANAINSPPVAGGDVIAYQVLSDTAHTVLFIGDLVTNDTFELFSAVLGTTGNTKISGAMVAGGNITALQVSPDKSRVAFIADREVDEKYELYSMSVAGGTVDKLSGTLASGGDVTAFQYTPDGRKVIYIADQDADGTFELYSTSPLAGPNVKISGPLVGGGNVASFQISPDSSRAVYLADQATDGRTELYSVPAGSGTPVRLNGNLPAGGNVTSFQISSDSAVVNYLADQNADEVYELFSVSLAGGAPFRVNAALPLNADVTAFSSMPGSSSAAYIADLNNDEMFELFSTQLPSRWKNAGGSWDSYPNWQGDLPDSAIDAIIDSPSLVTVAGNSLREVYSLTLGGGAQTSILELQNGAVISALHGLALLNGGVLAGDGTVSTGGTSLAVPANAEISAANGESLAFASGAVTNGGRVEALGNALAPAEVEFFAPVTNANGTGLITGHDAVLRFNSGLTNQGSLTFSGGFNDVFGDIANAAGPGRIIVSGGASVTFYDDVVNSGSVQVSSVGGLAGTAIFFGGFSGNGIAGGGRVFLEGDTRPGFSPGTMSFGGDVSHGPQATLHVEIAGTTPGAQYDRLVVSGQLTLAGTLEVTLLNGFVPAAGMEFDLWDAAAVSGGFDTVQLPALPAGLFWQTRRLGTEGVVSVAVTPENYASFASFHHLTTPAQGDQEGDGLRNDLEYALGLNPVTPTAATAAGLPAFTKAGTNDVFSFQMPTLSSPDVELRIESSPDLVNWTVLATRTGGNAWSGPAPVVLTPATAGYETVTLTRPTPGTTRQFYRLSTRLLP